ncbi:L-2-hydroxyglutarate oxidase [Olivibacter sp. SA151]|uniref:L-2-hydroxyglutarate oxidase n=1 Tax=Olivibacter jilunii TaxID=985016 RepID=UPI003F1678C5
MPKGYDFVIIGGGLVGLSTAYHLKKRFPKKSLLLLEKESVVAKHQSGHNSGVIHSGIYYKPGSLKAINCIQGYQSLLEFAQKYGIPFDICGKIIVATSEEEIPVLQTIFDRGIQNELAGIKLLSKEEISEYEPHVSGLRGIHVPQTGIIDYPAFAKQLAVLLTDELGAEIRLNEQVIDIQKGVDHLTIITDKSDYSAVKAVSCAGLQSDRIASLSESDNDLRIIPFRGEYYKIKPERHYLVKNLVYPVPDPKFPFLGVHFTRMIHGGIEAGPNAVLAFKREGYNFIDVNLKDSVATLMWPGFWKIAARYGKIGLGEMYRSLSKKAFTKALQKLIPEITEDDLIEGGAGVRAQACDRKGNLIDDFNILQKDNLVHVRNAPSPAATSCLSIGQYISNRL